MFSEKNVFRKQKSSKKKNPTVPFSLGFLPIFNDSFLFCVPSNTDTTLRSSFFIYVRYKNQLRLGIYAS
jgi:hypothetical protein